MTKVSIPRVGLDTNVVFSGLAIGKGNPFRILEYWRGGAMDLIVREALIVEYGEVLRRPSFILKFDPDESILTTFFDGLLVNATFIDESAASSLECRDPKDAKFLHAACSVPGSFLVTGDEDLLALADDASMHRIMILNPRAFLDILNNPTE